MALVNLHVVSLRCLLLVYWNITALPCGVYLMPLDEIAPILLIVLSNRDKPFPFG